MPLMDESTDGLIDSVRLAVAGFEVASPATSACLANSFAAAAFDTGSSRSAVFVGAGLLALCRTSADRTVQVLCVHNISDEEQSFLPAQHLTGPVHGTASLMFLSGETATVDTPRGLRCALKPSGFVWLGCYTSS